MRAGTGFTTCPSRIESNSQHAARTIPQNVYKCLIQLFQLWCQFEGLLAVMESGENSQLSSATHSSRYDSSSLTVSSTLGSPSRRLRPQRNKAQSFKGDLLDPRVSIVPFEDFEGISFWLSFWFCKNMNDLRAHRQSIYTQKHQKQKSGYRHDASQSCKGSGALLGILTKHPLTIFLRTKLQFCWK